MNPKKHLEYYGKLYPRAWKQVDMFRADRGKDLPNWPDWCFLPLAGTFGIVSVEAERQGIDINSPEGLMLVNDVGVLGALAAWRVTQGIYRFDPDVFAAVINTPITGDLPHEVFFNLPEWCVYIETPGLSVYKTPLNGFFAHLEHDANDRRTELRMVLDYTMPENTQPYLVSQVIHLGPWSLVEAVEKAMQESRRVAKGGGSAVGALAEQIEPDTEVHMQENLMPLLSLLLYICSVNGEIGDGERQPVRPEPKKTKKGLRMFPPQKATVWDVGIRMGAALRRSKEASYISDIVETPDIATRQRTSPRPHVRRAHWHGFWTGPRDGSRNFILKWISPVLVGGRGEDDLPVTVRPVK